jgi:hypothetical protein
MEKYQTAHRQQFFTPMQRRLFATKANRKQKIGGRERFRFFHLTRFSPRRGSRRQTTSTHAAEVFLSSEQYHTTTATPAHRSVKWEGKKHRRGDGRRSLTSASFFQKIDRCFFQQRRKESLSLLSTRTRGSTAATTRNSCPAASS